MTAIRQRVATLGHRPAGRVAAAAIAVSLAAACSRDSRPDLQDDVRLHSPQRDAIVASPLVVEGEARGSWFFEASFPVRVLDAAGLEIAVAPAQAIGEWMTPDFVPFAATLEFDSPVAGTRGTIVLEKANASGLQEHAGELRIPVTFAVSPLRGETADATMTVQVFFSNATLVEGADIDCAVVFPVARLVPRTAAPARAALEALVAGPTADERARGYTTSIGPHVEIRSLAIDQGVARVDFSAALERTGGACVVTAIRSQIETTLEQFPSVRVVHIAIDGRSADILQP